MYAIVKSGGKQYKVAPGDTIKFEKLAVEEGQPVEFSEVLMISNGDKPTFGQPYLSGASVQGEVVKQGRHDKVEIIKFKRRKHQMKHQGHRQYFTEVKITDIKGV